MNNIDIIKYASLLHEICQRDGYSVISQHTLLQIIKCYIDIYKSPMAPGVSTSQQHNESSIITNKQESNVNEVINMFDHEKTTKQTTSNEYDFTSIMKKNKVNKQRQQDIKKKANKNIIRSHKLKR